MRRMILLLMLMLAAVPAAAQITMGGNAPAAATRVYDSAGQPLPFAIGRDEFAFITGTTVTIPTGLTIAYTSGTFDLAISATDQYLIDANTTNHTGTDPVFEIDMESSTVGNIAFGLGLIVTNGASPAVDIYLGQWTMTTNDADADVKGIHYTAAASANADAGSFESFFTLDCAENTAGACVDGILITSSGINTGLVDGIDVSAANITNAINVGVNPIVTGNVAGTIGDATTDSWTLTTDGTGDAEIALPENSVGPDEVAVFHDSVIFCGENTENGTGYFGPGTAFFLGNYGTSLALASAGCDALDNTTEGTADAPLVAGLAYKVTGMWCQTDGTLGAAETLTFTLRSAEADTTPVISCAMATGETFCRSVTGSTTDIAAGATIAVKVVEVSNNADDNAWCKVGIALK